MEKFRRRLFFLRHGIMSKWIVITCLIIIPVNVVSIMTVYTVGTSYLEKMTERLRGKLNSFTQEKNNDHQTLQNGILSDILSSDNLYVFSNGSDSDSIMTDIRLKNSLNFLQPHFQDFTAYYLYDREKDFISFFNKKSAGKLDVERQALADVQGMDTGKTALFQLWTAQGKHYLSVNYPFRFFTFGYLVNLDTLAESCYRQCGESIGHVMITDTEGTIITAYPIHEENESIQSDAGGIHLETDVGSIALQLHYTVQSAEVHRLYPGLFYVFFAFAVLSVMVIPLLYLLAKRLILQPVRALTEGIQEVEGGDLEYKVPEKFGTLEMDYLAHSFNHMTGEIRNMRIASYEQEIGKLQTETINAHLQVNQHMLMNSLNVVYSLIQMKRYDEASEFTVLLMKYFQYALRKNSAIVTVREEMTFVEDYVRLQKIRLKNRFTSVCQVTEEAKDSQIPQLLIQGFVENAIKYAITPDRVTEILIDVRLREGRLLISVVDTGNGMEKKRLQALQEGKAVEDATGKHVGLWNVRKRLDYYYGEDYRLEISSNPGEGTLIHVSLPPQTADKKTIAVMLHKKDQDEGGVQDDSAACR